MRILISLLPVLVFLLILLYMDGFKLVRKKVLLACFLWGAVSAVLSYFANTGIISSISFTLNDMGRFISPFVEETLKALLLIFLIRKKRFGFMIDGAICGFAVGSGFAIIENIYFLHQIPEYSIGLWIIRGFGTAIMHGGTVSVLGIIIMNAFEKQKRLWGATGRGLLLAVSIHLFYNAFIIPPVLQMMLILVVIVVLELMIFRINTKSLRKWLELEFDSEVKLLMMIWEGRFSSTKYGEYINAIKNNFDQLVVIDMLSYISLYLELSVRAKTKLLMNEAGLPAKKDPEINTQLKELKSLEKNIGLTGLLALSPILRMSRKDLWKWSMLK